MVLPNVLVDKKERGIHVHVELPIEARVQNILEDYKPWEYAKECMEAFQIIKSRIHTPIAAEIEDCLKDGQYDRAIELLLVYYYDPHYEYSESKYENSEFVTIQAQSVDEALAAVEQMLNNMPGTKK
ncbi:tRNA 2-selenouridine synthase [compost metagenome]